MAGKTNVPLTEIKTSDLSCNNPKLSAHAKMKTNNLLQHDEQLKSDVQSTLTLGLVDYTLIYVTLLSSGLLWL